MFREKTEWMGKKYHSLKDIIGKKLDILFVGLNPSIVSVEAGHYHWGILGRRFWQTIIRGGILKPEAGRYNDELLLRQNMGITDIVKRPTRGCEDLTREDFEEGRRILYQKITGYKPKIVCSIYKRAMEELLSTKFTNLDGLQDTYRIGRSRIFIMAPAFKPPDYRFKNIQELKKLRESL